MILPEIPKDIDKREEFSEKELEVEELFNNTLLQSEEDIDKKTVPYIEKQVRNSYEYRNYIRYLKEELDMRECSLIPGLNQDDVKFSLEFHHFPMNLYEISEAVLKSKLDNLTENSPGVSLFEVSEEVTKMHYLNEIGLVPLSETAHQMAHNKAIIIPLKSVYGKYENFIKRYQKYIDPEILERIEDAKSFNDSEEVEEHNKEKLLKNVTHYNITYKNSGNSDNNSL